MTSFYVPSVADEARYSRLMLVHPETLGTPCSGGWQKPCLKARCRRCGGLRYVAPPPETWCAHLVREAGKVGFSMNYHSPDRAVVWHGNNPGYPYDAPVPESALLLALEQAAGASAGRKDAVD